MAANFHVRRDKMSDITWWMDDDYAYLSVMALSRNNCFFKQKNLIAAL